MATKMKQCVPLPLDEALLLEITQKSKDYAIMHGISMRSKASFNPDSLDVAPFILTPSSFPRAQFQKAVDLQTVLNELMHKVAHDDEFLRTSLAETIKVDEFTGNLFKIYEKTLEKGLTQDAVSLGLFRSDYLAHCYDNNDIKQVEFNTIASSFGGISTNMTPLQSYVLREMGEDDKLKDLPENKALSGLCDGMVKAWELYGNPQASILFVIEDVSYNICDQRFHEFYIRENYPHIKVLRRTLTEIHLQSKLGPNNELLLDNEEISVIYFRAGYEPGHYKSQNEWDARLLMELSKAIKSPSIHYHLAGTKKVQQALAQPGVLKRFIDDEETIGSIKQIFTGLYSLEDNEEGQAAYEMALKDPERYVLKPQREGGGNNVYGEDIPDALKNMTPVERSAWILMDRIHPPIIEGYMIRPNAPVPPALVELVSELGIFGVIIGTEKEIFTNYQAGHMLRTKLATADEGGVAAGLGALDSPYLVDQCC